MIARAQSPRLRVIDAPDVAMQKLLVVLLTMQTAGLVNAGFPRSPYDGDCLESTAACCC
jgi:hypothetical protein